MTRPPERAYLSGGMEHANNRGLAWRDDLASWLQATLGHSSFNPVRESERRLLRLTGRRTIYAMKRTNPEKYASIVRHLVRRDLDEIARRADYLVCYWDRAAERGAGTQGEVTLAWFLGKPVYLVTRKRLDNVPGWILASSTRTFPSFASLKRFLIHTYGTSGGHHNA